MKVIKLALLLLATGLTWGQTVDWNTQIRNKPPIPSAVQGNGGKVQLSTGTTTTNNCVKYDANGNTVDAGAPCGTGTGVSSFNSRTGAVVPALNDYNFNQLNGSLATGQVATPQGNGAKIQLSTGSTTPSNCVQFDANGNTVDSGAPCGGTPALGYLLTSQYTFTQSPGGNLTSGISNTITLTPCPQGVAGADSNHYLYVSGGIGTAEPVKITGGTCTSGGTTGTIIFTPANSHTGGWSISSATAGGQEALNVAIAAGSYRHVHYPSGSFTVYAPINGNGNSNILLDGDLGTTVINLAFPTGFTTTSVSPWNPAITVGTAYFFTDSGTEGATATVTADTNGANAMLTRVFSTTLSVVVSAVPGSWGIGSYIGMQYMGWGNNSGAQAGQQEFWQAARIANIVGTTVTFEEAVVIPLASSAIAGPPGRNQSLLTLENFISNVAVQNLIIDGVGSSGAYGGIGLFYAINSGAQNLELRNLNNGGVHIGKSYKPFVRDISTYNVSGFADVWLVGSDHAQVARIRSDKPNFGFDAFWSTFLQASDIQTHNSQGRGMKFHGCVHCNGSNFIVDHAQDTGFGIQGGSYNSHFSNITALNSVGANGWGIFFSGEGNLNNMISNVTAMNNNGGAGTADMVFGSAFGLSDNWNTVTGLYAPGGWVDQSNTNAVVMWQNPASGAYASGAQSIPDSTNTAVTFDTNMWDFPGSDNAVIHSTSVNTSRFTIPNSSQGVYRATCTISFASNATGSREVILAIDGTTTFGLTQAAAISGANTVISTSGEINTSGTHYMECFARQTSGGSLNTIGGTGATQMSIERVR